VPTTKIVFYQEEEGGAVPVIDWLNELKQEIDNKPNISDYITIKIWFIILNHVRMW